VRLQSSVNAGKKMSGFKESYSEEFKYSVQQESYLTELTDSWDWANGKLTINAGWTYTQ
jgi:hypothetical protein